LLGLLEFQGVDAGHLGCRPGLWKLGGVDINIKVVTLQACHAFSQELVPPDEVVEQLVQNVLAVVAVSLSLIRPSAPHQIACIGRQANGSISDVLVYSARNCLLWRLC